MMEGGTESVLRFKEEETNAVSTKNNQCISYNKPSTYPSHTHSFTTQLNLQGFKLPHPRGYRDQESKEHATNLTTHGLPS